MSTTLYANGVMTTTGPAIKFPGRPGDIIKTELFRVPSAYNDFSVSTNTDVEWFSMSFTTLCANSRILITYHSGQIKRPIQLCNPRINFSVNSTTRGGNMDHTRDHNHEWYDYNPGGSDGRSFITGHALSSQIVTPGAQTVRVFAGAYNNAITFGYQMANADGAASINATRAGSFLLQELGA